MYLYYSGATSSPSTAIPPASSLRSIPLIEPGKAELPLMSVPVSLPTTTCTLVGSGSGLSTNPAAASNPLPLLHTTIWFLYLTSSSDVVFSTPANPCSGSGEDLRRPIL